MSVRELYYAQNGSMCYEDTDIATGWYPAPYDTLAMRAALMSQAYVTDDPVNALEIANKKYVDYCVRFERNASNMLQPKDRIAGEGGGYYDLVPRVTGYGNLGSTALWWAGVFANAVTIGINEALAATRLVVRGYSDTVPLQEWGDGDVIYTRIGRSATNVMYMSQANYGAANFEFRGNYEFKNAITCSNITINEGCTVGRAAGPLLTFNEANNVLKLEGAYLQIMGVTDWVNVKPDQVTAYGLLAGSWIENQGGRDLSIIGQVAGTVGYGLRLAYYSGNIGWLYGLALLNVATGYSTLALMAGGGNVSIGSLTASLPVVSDASRNLVSLAYTGATSFRKNLGLEQDDSPTWAGINVNTLIGVRGFFYSATSANRHIAQLYLYDNSAVAADVGGEMIFGGKYTTAGLYTEWAAIGGFKDNADGGGGEYGGYLEFYTRTTGDLLVKRAKITSAGAFIINETLTVTKAFGCNAATAQTAYASGGAAGGTPTLTTGYGFVTDTEMNAHTALVEKIRAALVANGIMS